MSDDITRDWDAERAKRFPKPVTFRIGGQVFTLIQGMTPEEYAAKAQPFFEIDSETSADEALLRTDTMIVAFCAEPDAEERWKKVRAQRNPAVTAREMREIALFIIREQTGVPMTLPEPSLNGDESTGENSTESSSSDPAASEVLPA